MIQAEEDETEELVKAVQGFDAFKGIPGILFYSGRTKDEEAVKVVVETFQNLGFKYITIAIGGYKGNIHLSNSCVKISVEAINQIEIEIEIDIDIESLSPKIKQKKEEKNFFF